MARKTYIIPEKLWDYCQEHGKELEEAEVLVMEDEETGYELSVTTPIAGYSLRLHVYKDDKQLLEKFVFSRENLIESVNEAIRLYFNAVQTTSTPKKLDAGAQKSEKSDVAENEDSTDDIMYEREDALYMAARDFLEVALDYGGEHSSLDTFEEGLVEDFLDKALQYLTTEYSAIIYRPVYLKDEDGNESFEEYPYLSLICDSEDDLKPKEDKDKKESK